MNKVLAFMLLVGLASVSAASISFTSISAAWAAPTTWARAYDLVYDISTPAGKSQMHQMADGKGHLRTESSLGGQKVVTILDFPGNMAITIMDAQKMYIKQAMSPAQAQAADLAKKDSSAKDIGKKVVGSHPCHGYESKSGGSVSTVWVGDDINNVVHSETKSPQGDTVMDLKSYSGKAPSQDLLAVPSGYKEMKMPAVAHAK